MNKPTVVSTFAGCGGSSLGYRFAGFTELLATDWDKNSVETLKNNFPDTHIIQEDITKLTPEKIMEITGLKPGELTVLDGSPPCQGFSIAGARQIKDPRNALFNAYIKLLNGLKPKAFVMENVPGMVMGKMKGVFNTIVEELKKTDYEVSIQICNSADYGVPQSRRRLFFVGIRKDFGKKFVFPTPTTPNHITCYQAVRDLVITEKLSYPGNAITKKVLSVAREGQGGSTFNRGSYFSLKRASRFKPCQTITKTAVLYHWSEDRYLTIQELKRFSTFPDDFKFHGIHRQQWARIGNAVMPKMMEAIAKQIVVTLGKQC